MPPLCKQLPVSASDLDDLRRSGLSNRTIRANGLRTAHNSLEFPYRNLAGEMNCFVRRRPHHPRLDADGKPIKYEQPKGTKPRAYFPVESLPLLRDGESPVYMTEGEKKALALSQLDVAAVGLGGVWCWKIKDTDKLIPDLAEIKWEGREVFPVFDYDKKRKTRHNVNDARKRLAKALLAAGAKAVYSVDLPPAADGGKQGVDDFLYVHGADEFRALVAETKAAADRAPGAYRKSKWEAIEKPKGTYRKFKGEDIPAALATLKALYRHHYYFSDDAVIDLVLGVVAGNHFDSDPIWMHLISPPSGGKTELLYSIFDCEDTYFLSDFTAAALISGYKDPPQDTPPAEKSDSAPSADATTDDSDDDYSLLPHLDGKVVVTKDFSLIHDKPSETRAQILSILRDVYDGYASRALGNSVPKGFHARFNYLTGMTPDIEKSWSLNTLGERFLMYRISIDDRREHARRSLRNANKSQGIRTELQRAVKEFIGRVPDFTPEFDAAMENRILDLADLLSTCRTYVHRERNDALVCLPRAELASRVAKQLLRVGQSVALVRGKPSITEHEFEIMKRIALDSLPTNRRQLLASLWQRRKRSEPLKVFQSDVCRLAPTTIRRELDNLFQLDVVSREKRRVSSFKSDKKTGETTKDTFQLTQTFIQYCQNVGGIPPT